jgi:oligosaccharyltransferase complex subunit beta
MLSRPLPLSLVIPLFLFCYLVQFPSEVSAGATVYTQPTALPRRRTLVLLSLESDRHTYPAFFNALESVVQVEYKTTAILQRFGEFLYDNLIIFGSTRELPIDVLSFVDGGNNVMIVARPIQENEEADSSLPLYLREAAIQCGVYFSHHNVEDHFHYYQTLDQIVTHQLIQAKTIFPNPPKKPLVYRGLGLMLERRNPLLLRILTAESTAFIPSVTVEDKTQTPEGIGKDIVLIAGLQTRQGSRMTFVGSTTLFDATGEHAERLQLMKQLVEWNFQQRGVIRYSNVFHSKQVEDGKMPYRIRDHLHYSVKIEEFKEAAWSPYQAEDIQLEFTMIDPYIRKSLVYNTTANDGTYYLNFQAPDVYGIFKFLVDYRRVGYSPLIFYNQTTVRPLKLNEFERFIPAAFPYYLCTFSVMFGFILFSIVFLNLKEPTS